MRGLSLSKSLAAFRRRGGEKKSDYFLRQHVRRRKYRSSCKCGICAPPAHKLCAQQTAAPLSKSITFDSLSAAKKPPGEAMLHPAACIRYAGADHAPVSAQSLTVTTLSATTAEASPCGCTDSIRVLVPPMYGFISRALSVA